MPARPSLATRTRRALTEWIGRANASPWRDRGGSVAIVFGVAAVPIVAMLGAGVDYARVVAYRSGLQEAVDAAALAGVTAQRDGKDATQAAKAFMAHKYGEGVGNAATAVQPDPNGGKVTVRGTIQVPTTLLRLVSPNAVTISATATASQSSGDKMAEVVIALDTTGSMSGTKLTAAQNAAKDLVDKLFSQPNASSMMRVGLVPFDMYVNVGTQYRGSSWLSNTANYSTKNPDACWSTYPDAKKTGSVYQARTCYNDGTPYDCSGYNDTWDYGAPKQVCGPQGDSNYVWNGCVGSQASPYDVGDIANSSNPAPGLYNTDCSSPLVRLTGNKGAITSQIAQLSASHETYIAPAVTWAWRLLSPDGPFTGDAKAYGAANKTVVLMTDGANTRAPSYPRHDSSDTNLADTRLRQVCANLKAKGVSIFTIAFAVTDATIKNTLANCSSGPPYYYDAQSEAALTTAFASIANQLTAVRLTR